ncbi:MAG: hypothetical protein ACI35Z_06825 [Sphingobacterium hotanense]
MKKNYSLLSKAIFAFLLSIAASGNFAFAQGEDSHLQKLHAIELSPVTPGIRYIYETPVSRKSTFEFTAGLDASLVFEYSKSYVKINEDRIEEKEKRFQFYLTPNIGLAYKFYYNLDKRVEAGKNVDNNAGNYFGLRLINGLEGWTTEKVKTDAYTMKRQGFSKNYIGFASAVWGMNRNLGKNFVFNFEVGPGNVFGEDRESEFSIRLNTGFKKVF